MLRKDRSEDGSVIMAVLVVMICTFAVVALLVTVVGGLNSSRNDQNRINAFQHANAGIDDALYRLDKNQLPTTASASADGSKKYTPIKNSAGALVGFDETLKIGTSTFEVFARQTPENQTRVWTVRSIGTDVSGRKRQAITTIEATPLFINGFFTNQDFSLSGNQTTPIAYHSDACPNPITMTGTDCNLPAPVPGFLGTNGTFGNDKMSNQTAEAFKDSWEGFNMYGRTSQAAADAACADGRCAPKANAITDKLVIVTPPKPTSPPPGGCPNFTQPIPPGDYACASMNLPATAITVSGTTGNVRIWLDGPLSASKGTTVNYGQPARRFQVFQTENPSSTANPKGTWPGSICDAKFFALLYTPGLAVDCVGSHQPALYGAVVAQLHGGTGNQFDFHWDIDSLNVVHDSKYVLRDWRECPADKTSC